jgi:hypothetical protein
MILKELSSKLLTLLCITFAINVARKWRLLRENVAQQEQQS